MVGTQFLGEAARHGHDSGASGRPRDGPTDAGQLALCRHGASCPWHALGRCLFFHPAASAGSVRGGRAGLPTLLDFKVIPQGAVGWSMDAVFGQWAGRTQCKALIIHDPYLCGVRHSSEMYPMMERMTNEEFVAALADAGIGKITGLAHLDDLTRVIDNASGFLTSVRLHTRGMLRPDVPADGLLERWAVGYRARWACRGITLELVVDPRLHARRCILQGTAEAIEIALEWGLAWHVDTTANAIIDPTQRAAKRTELMVLAHAGVWQDHTFHAAQQETAGQSFRRPAAPGRPMVDVVVERRLLLAGILRRLLMASRRKSWYGRVRCMCCGNVRPAPGAMVQLASGRVLQVRIGGAHCQVALDVGVLNMVQCADCASSPFWAGPEMLDRVAVLSGWAETIAC